MNTIHTPESIEAKRLANNAYMRVWSKANRKRITAQRKAARASNPVDKRAYDQAYRAANIDKMRAYSKAYYLANRDERIAASKADYVKNTERNKARIAAYCALHAEHYKAKHAEYHVANRDALNAANRIRSAIASANRTPEAKAARNAAGRANHFANREKRLLQKAEWSRANPAKNSGYSNKRRAFKLNATPVWADLTAIERIYELAVQRTADTGIKHEVDHIVPLISEWVCGLHVEHNLRVMERGLNRSKGNFFVPGDC